MMMPKHIADRYRLGKYSKRQGNVNYYENKVNEIENRQSKLSPEENIIDKVKSKYYDIIGKHYAKKLDKSRKLLEKLQQKGVQTRILGANAAAISKKATDKLRQRMQNQTKEEPIKAEQPEKEGVQQQPKMEERQLPAVISQAPIPENITAASLAEEAVRNADMSRTATQTKAA